MAERDAVVFCEEPPEFDYKKGLFHIVMRLGERRFERVMPPDVFFETIARAVEVSRKHRRGKLVAISDHAATGKSSK